MTSIANNFPPSNTPSRVVEAPKGHLRASFGITKTTETMFVCVAPPCSSIPRRNSIQAPAGPAIFRPLPPMPSRKSKIEAIGWSGPKYAAPNAKATSDTFFLTDLVPRVFAIASIPRRSISYRGTTPVERYAHSSRCTVFGENAGKQTATYSAPSSPGVE